MTKLRIDEIAIQCCTKHWEMMEGALASRGMDYLISKNGEEAEGIFKNADGNPLTMTDPLLQAFVMMGAQLVESGVSSDTLDELAGKSLCPVCTAMMITKDSPENTETHWTAGLADFLLEDYRERGVLPRLQ